jgi:hypothetical protein
MPRHSAGTGLQHEYVVEAGGHAGSTIERLSVKGMVNDINAMSPTGLSTALRYARGTAGAAAAELDYLAFRSVRQWLAELGLALSHTSLARAWRRGQASSCGPRSARPPPARRSPMLLSSSCIPLRPSLSSMRALRSSQTHRTRTPTRLTESEPWVSHTHTLSHTPTCGAGICGLAWRTFTLSGPRDVQRPTGLLPQERNELCPSFSHDSTRRWAPFWRGPASPTHGKRSPPVFFPKKCRARFFASHHWEK